MHSTQVYLNDINAGKKQETLKTLVECSLSKTTLKEVRLPESCKKVFCVIVEDGPVSSKEIVEKVSCSTRSVRYALKRLLDNEFVEKRPCLSDMRQTLYCARPNRIEEQMIALHRIQ